MSSNTIQPTLDFLPASGGAKRPRAALTLLVEVFKSIVEGLDAAHHYERLTARGTHPADAVGIVFREHFKKNE